MKTFLKIVLVMSMLLFSYCSVISYIGSDEWHEKITIIVDTPEGEVQAHSVQRLYILSGDLVTGRSLLHRNGEAVVLELPTSNGPRYLFGLLNVRWKSRRLYKQHPKKNWWGMSSLIGVPPRVMMHEHYPMLVTFDDINDPMSVKLVNPANMAASFGAGYALKSITMEITDEPVTEGRVEQVLGWLKNIWPNTLDGKRFHTSRAKNQVANSLTANHFSTEVSK